MALAVWPEERNEEKEHEREKRETDDDDRFRRRRDQREHREVAEEVPVGAGIGKDVGTGRMQVTPEERNRERQGECREEEERSGEPVRLARELERAEQIDLRHVREDEDHHRAGAEVVHTADDRAEGRTVTDELQRVVRRVGRRHVGHREADAGDDLHHKYPEGGAAEDVPPSDWALELAGHGMTQHRHDAVLELEAFAKPARDATWELREGAQEPHPCFTVGSGCCRTSSRSPLTCHSRSKSRRGGGPPATEPSL